MSWDSLGMYALISGICWVIGAYGAFRNHRKVAVEVTGLGSLVFFLFIVGLWISLERPPLRTMGETRLWYSFFLSMIGTTFLFAGMEAKATGLPVRAQMFYYARYSFAPE